MLVVPIKGSLSEAEAVCALSDLADWFSFCHGALHDRLDAKSSSYLKFLDCWWCESNENKSAVDIQVANVQCSHYSLG